MAIGTLGWRSTPAIADRESTVDADPLVSGLRAGDPVALAETYDRYHASLRAFTRRLVGDASAAEDLVQEVFVSLPNAVKRFEGRSSLGTFLVSIAVNHARHHVRAAARRRRMLESLALEMPVLARDPEDGASDRQLANQLFVALDRLPMDQRVAFVLCEIEERSSAEVAAIVGAQEGTVRARVFHARRKLKALLAGDCTQGDVDE